MFAKAPSGAPRHMAGTKRAERSAHSPREGRAARAAHLLEPTSEVELAEVPAPARVRRSRLAFAVSVTVASLPILILDNFPATADTGGRSAVEATASGSEQADATERSESGSEVDVARERDRLPGTSTTGAESTSSTEAAPAVEELPEVDAEPLADSSDDAEADADQSTLRSAEPAPEPAPAPAPSPAPTTTAPAPTPASEPSGYGDPADPATWDRLAQCESHGRWDLNTGNGYYGGLQFSLATWRDVGGAGYPHEASREEQIRRGQMLQARYGWGQWPHCSSELGYR